MHHSPSTAFPDSRTPEKPKDHGKDSQNSEYHSNLNPMRQPDVGFDIAVQGLCLLVSRNTVGVNGGSQRCREPSSLEKLF